MNPLLMQVDDGGAGDLAGEVKDVVSDYWLGLDRTKLTVVAVLFGVLVAFYVFRKVRRAIRRRRPARLHPKLQRYGGGTGAGAGDGLDAGGVAGVGAEDLAARRRAEASRIVATSSTGRIAGYEIIEQIEAVYVDGFRRPEEALEGLKATAAMKGANALVHVHQDRSAGGRCSGSGDAVIVRKYVIAEDTAGDAGGERPDVADSGAGEDDDSRPGPVA